MDYGFDGFVFGTLAIPSYDMLGIVAFADILKNFVDGILDISGMRLVFTL